MIDKHNIICNLYADAVSVSEIDGVFKAYDKDGVEVSIVQSDIDAEYAKVEYKDKRIFEGKYFVPAVTPTVIFSMAASASSSLRPELRMPSAPTFDANLISSTDSEVLFEPAPAITGILPELVLTTISITSLCSS